MPRTAHWAGQFYPGDAARLAAEVDRLLAAWPPAPAGEPSPWALLVPHAGYPYSGLTAAAAYTRITGEVARVVLLGPSHHQPFQGFALSREDRWETPLGDLAVDTAAVDDLLAAGSPFRLDEATLAGEHSLEVQLPFLQRRLPRVTILPVLMGWADADERAAARDALGRLARPGDLWVVTTDLSHYHSRDEADRLDGEAERLIAAGDAAGFAAALAGGRLEACGAGPVQLLLEELADRGGRVAVLDRRDSSDGSGVTSEVVGYLAAAFLAA
jgi:AmmeMemoRadiSam system protein B